MGLWGSGGAFPGNQSQVPLRPLWLLRTWVGCSRVRCPQMILFDTHSNGSTICGWLAETEGTEGFTCQIWAAQPQNLECSRSFATVVVCSCHMASSGAKPVWRMSVKTLLLVAGGSRIIFFALQLGRCSHLLLETCSSWSQENVSVPFRQRLGLLIIKENMNLATHQDHIFRCFCCFYSHWVEPLCSLGQMA